MSEPIEGLFGVYASPVATEDRIYVTGRSGNVAVLMPGKELKVERINKLGEPVDASPAIVGNEIYVRSRTHLYCIAEAKSSTLPPTRSLPSSNLS